MLLFPCNSAMRNFAKFSIFCVPTVLRVRRHGINHEIHKNVNGIPTKKNKLN